MKVRVNKTYHFYNQGNNSEPIFYQTSNYFYFLRKVRKYLLPQVNILGYCLMPNHFHFLIYPNKYFTPVVFSQHIRIFLSSYTRGINNQENRSGSLFRQNSKAKIVDERDYALTCFRYIHQNPISHGFVDKIEEWKYSSTRDYLGLRNGSLCNKELAYKLWGLPRERKELLKFLKQEISQLELENIY